MPDIFSQANIHCVSNNNLYAGAPCARQGDDVAEVTMIFTTTPARGGGCTAGYLSFYPIVSIQLSCCDLNVREKAWRGKPGL